MVERGACPPRFTISDDTWPSSSAIELGSLYRPNLVGEHPFTPGNTYGLTIWVDTGGDLEDTDTCTISAEIYQPPPARCSTPGRSRRPPGPPDPVDIGEKFRSEEKKTDDSSPSGVYKGVGSFKLEVETTDPIGR